MRTVDLSVWRELGAVPAVYEAFGHPILQVIVEIASPKRQSGCRRALVAAPRCAFVLDRARVVSEGGSHYPVRTEVDGVEAFSGNETNESALVILR
jgi:hypothetical protein